MVDVSKHPLAPSLEQEAVALKFQKDPKHRNWTDEHNAALANPRGFELALVKLAEGIAAYLEVSEFDQGNPWRDYVLGEGFADIVKGFKTLLDGPTGRLDSGTLSAFASATLERAGFDPDTGSWDDRYYVSKDGARVSGPHETSLEAMGALHRIFGAGSADYAITHAGYSIHKGSDA